MCSKKIIASVPGRREPTGHIAAKCCISHGNNSLTQWCIYQNFTLYNKLFKNHKNKCTRPVTFWQAVSRWVWVVCFSELSYDIVEMQMTDTPQLSNSKHHSVTWLLCPQSRSGVLQWVCLSVSQHVYIKNYVSALHQIFYTCYCWLWLVPLLVALLWWWCHVCPLSTNQRQST